MRAHFCWNEKPWRRGPVRQRSWDIDLLIPYLQVVLPTGWASQAASRKSRKERLQVMDA
jgi:hypothetical protein